MTTAGISAYLEQLELNKNDLTKAILRLAVEWKDLDEHLDPTQKFSDEYEAKKKDLELFQDYLAEKKRELSSVEESLGLRLGELECREDVFRSFQMARIEEIKTREEQTDAHMMWVVQRMEEIESRDNMLIEKEKSIELLLEKFMTEKQDLAEILKSVGEKLNALSQKEKRCEDVCEELDSREIQIVLREDKLKAREKVNDFHYKENEMKIQVRLKELDSRETQVALREEQLEAREKVNDLSYKENEMKVQVRSKELDSRELQVVLREEQLEAREKVNDVCYKENEMKVQLLLRELDSREIGLREERLKAIQYNEEHMKLFEIKIGDLFKELDTIEKLNKTRAGELDLGGKQLDLKEEQLKQIQERNEEYCNALEIKSRGMYNEPNPLRDLSEGLPVDLKSNNELEISDHDSSEVLKLQSERKQVKFSLKNNKKKQIEDTRKLFEERIKEKQAEETPGKNHFEGNQLGSEPAINLLRGKQPLKSQWKGKQYDNNYNGGRYLQAYLNEHFDYPEIDVYEILRLSSDPAKLVLDAMEGFYPPHLLTGDVQFEASVVRKSCVFLLEQLMILSPPVSPEVKEEAVRLAHEWKSKIEASTKECPMVLAFLLLFVSYKLASEFCADEILELLMFVPLEKQRPEFFSLLGLQEKVTDFIKRLVEKGLHLDAIKYVCAFKVVDDFPPASLLADYINYKERRYSLKAQDTATRKELKALRAVISTVRLHKLEEEYPLNDFIMRVEELERDGSPPLDFDRKETNEKKRKHMIGENDADTQTLNLYKLYHAAGPELNYHHKPSSDCPVGPTYAPSSTSQSDIISLHPPLHPTQTPYCPFEPSSDLSHSSQSATLPLRSSPHVTPQPTQSPSIRSYNMSQSYMPPLQPPPHLSAPHCQVGPTSNPFYISQSGKLPLPSSPLVTPPLFPLQAPPYLAQTPTYPVRFNSISSYTSQHNLFPLHTTPHFAPPRGHVGPTSAPLYMNQSDTTLLLTPPNLPGKHFASVPGARGANLVNFWSMA